MLLRPRIAALAVASAVVLAACSGTDSDDPVEPPPSEPTASSSASPTPGTQVSKDPFALTLPDGWTESEPGNALLLALSDQVVDDLPTSVNVVEDSTLAAVSPDALEDRLVKIVTGPQGSDIQPRGTYEIDGEDGARISQTLSINGLETAAERIAVIHDDTGYLVTFTFAPSISAEDRDETVDEIMTTWTWAS